MDLVIWSSSNIKLATVPHVLAEDPTTELLNDFSFEITKTEVSDVNFLPKFAWMILKAQLRPQMHVVLLDSNRITKNNQAAIFKSCACAIDFVSSHPMKYVIFYDLINHKGGESMNSALQLSHKLQLQTENLSSFARLHTHQGHPLQPDLSKNGQLNYDGLVKLAKSIIHLTHQVLAKLND